MITIELAGQEWRRDAACLGHDPELWFPVDGDDRTRDEALRICRQCPVRIQCLHWALQAGDHYAILGGLTKRQRSTLRKKKAAWKRSTTRNTAGRTPSAASSSRQQSPS